VGGWGSAPYPAGGSCSTSSYSLAPLRALLLKGRKGRGGVGKGEERRGGEVVPPLFGRNYTPERL